MKFLTSSIAFAAVCLATALCSAQNDVPSVKAGTISPASAPNLAHSFDGLVVLGSDVPMPGYRETIMGDNSGMRRAMLRHGLAFRINSLPIFSANTLAAPVSADQQVYVGQRPFVKWGSNAILAWDLKSLHIHSAQLIIGTELEWESWNKAGPNAADLGNLYFFKSVNEGQFEIKAGYMENHLEFVGTQAGGSLITGSQGVFAVLPYEAGMSTFPETTPSFNLKWNAPARLYAKGSLQRAPDAAGAQPTIDRNRVGLRFIPKGDKLVIIGEGGYKQAATNSAHWTWLRGGYIHNSTPYTNFITGTKTSGNYCAYLLGDRQFTRNTGTIAGNGIYAGASAMIVPANMNTYTQYYEARVYDEGPFHSRPADTASLIVSHSVYSRDAVKKLIAQNKTFWRNSTSLTGSYTVRASRGMYFSIGVSYITGPAITPHVANALVATVAPAIFF